MKLKATMPLGGGLKQSTNAGGMIDVPGRGPGKDPKMPSTEIQTTKVSLGTEGTKVG